MKYTIFFLSLFMLSSCSRIKLREFSLSADFSNENLESGILKLNAGESKVVHYTIGDYNREPGDLSVHFQSMPSGLTASVSDFRKGANVYDEKELNFDITYTNTQAGPGSYQVAFWAQGRNSVIKEFRQTVEVVHFQASNLLGKTFHVNDTLNDDPFDSMNTYYIFMYDAQVSTVGASNPYEFFFSQMGIRGPSTLFSNMKVVIDSSTGALTIPLQNLISTQVSGYGKVYYRSDLFNKYTGYIYYKYTNTIGDKYEGKATF